ncbi:unnamed protein product [Symbiodinium microadriaticum]|nr:unnamed protein product [Symbiodinium microadriaticum]
MGALEAAWGAGSLPRVLGVLSHSLLREMNSAGGRQRTQLPYKCKVHFITEIRRKMPPPLPTALVGWGQCRCGRHSTAHRDLCEYPSVLRSCFDHGDDANRPFFVYGTVCRFSAWDSKSPTAFFGSYFAPSYDLKASVAGTDSATISSSSASSSSSSCTGGCSDLLHTAVAAAQLEAAITLMEALGQEMPDWPYSHLLILESKGGIPSARPSSVATGSGEARPTTGSVEEGETPPQSGTSNSASSPIPVESEEEAPGAAPKAKGAPPSHSPIPVESEEEAPAEAPNTRGEVLPRSAKERLQAIFAKAKSNPLTPHDRVELAAGEPSTPWARRVKLRSEPYRAEPGPPADMPRSHAEGELPILHGRRVGAGVPRNVLMSLPKTLGFEWDQGGPSGPLLEFLGKGQDRLHVAGMVLKLSQHSQKQELTLAKLLPGIAAPVFWVENVMVVLHDDKGGMQNIAMTCLCQQPVIKAVDVMEARGAVFSFRFLCHVGCILTWLWTQKLHLLDLGESNMGMEQASTAEAYPALRFFDLLSWQRQSKPDAKWHGYHALAQKVCPVHAKWIKAACSEVTKDAPKVFRLFADRLVQAGVMVDGELSPRQIFCELLPRVLSKAPLPVLGQGV